VRNSVVRSANHTWRVYEPGENAVNLAFERLAKGRRGLGRVGLAFGGSLVDSSTVSLQYCGALVEGRWNVTAPFFATFPESYVRLAGEAGER